MSCNQVSVGGRHIQYILETIFGIAITSEDKGHPLKQDEKKFYKLSGGIITSGTPYIEISFYGTYILTVTDNLFTFAIHNRVSENHIMKALTYDQQEEILIYLGFKKPKMLETKCGCKIIKDSKKHNECRCDEDGENWICANCYAGEYDDKPECCGKHCDETEGLKLGMGWNRWHSSVTDMITEQLWCENCYKDCVGNECKSCCEYYPYTEMTYHEGGAFGEALYCYDQYFCKSCVEYYNAIDYNPDEYV